MMDINALITNWETDFVNAMKTHRSTSTRESFRRGFAKSLCGQLTPREYEKATGWDFDTDEEFQAHLKTLWGKFYGDADPADSLA
jgi:hypothetical protein